MKKILLAGTAVSAVVLIAASAAWACTVAMPGSASLSRTAGEPGTTVVVTGRGFLVRPADWPDMEVRWNTTGGDLLARVKAPDFTVSIEVPKTGPAHRWIVVLQRQPSGAPQGWDPLPFEVTAPAPPPTPDAATPMVPEVPVLTPAPGLRAAPTVAPAPVPPAARQGAPTSPAGAPVVPGPVEDPSAAVAPGVAPLLPSAAGASASVAGPKVEVSTPEKTMLVDVRDLWSGVEPGDPAASSSSLMAPSDTRSTADSPLGAGLMLAGVGLLAGLALMGLTRRRATVSG